MLTFLKGVGEFVVFFGGFMLVVVLVAFSGDALRNCEPRAILTMQFVAIAESLVLVLVYIGRRR
jgi:hypothetical protein